jgi:hypothetical protein
MFMKVTVSEPCVILKDRIYLANQLQMDIKEITITSEEES